MSVVRCRLLRGVHPRRAYGRELVGGEPTALHHDFHRRDDIVASYDLFRRPRVARRCMGMGGAMGVQRRQALRDYLRQNAVLMFAGAWAGSTAGLATYWWGRGGDGRSG